MRRFRWLASLALLTACQSSSSDFQLGPTDANVAGQFTLVSINSNPLPVSALVTTAESWDLTSDTLSITADGKWAETTVYVVTQASDGSTSTRSTGVNGTYTIADQKINFMQTGGTATFTGSVRGSSLTLLYNGGHFFYVRT
ncbi:MAG TPA: hypothetical protein VL524_00550 [Gemmatimonadaceae bacterium]|nr:hypothetical protein [Gemmatimonadaceae bacterium]